MNNRTLLVLAVAALVSSCGEQDKIVGSWQRQSGEIFEFLKNGTLVYSNDTLKGRGGKWKRIEEKRISIQVDGQFGGEQICELVELKNHFALRNCGIDEIYRNTKVARERLRLFQCDAQLYPAANQFSVEIEPVDKIMCLIPSSSKDTCLFKSDVDNRHYQVSWAQDGPNKLIGVELKQIDGGDVFDVNLQFGERRTGGVWIHSLIHGYRKVGSCKETQAGAEK